MKKITLQNYSEDKYYPKVVDAVDKILIHGGEVRPIDVFIKMGLVEKKNIESWENGQIPYLEMVLHGSLSKLNRILRIIRFHAHDLNLRPKITPYKRGKKVLRFSKSGDAKLEEAYSRHFVKIGQSGAKRRDSETGISGNQMVEITK
ncbi:MAG: hypothetical protein L0Z73_06440 [Gammaproteobacteria bacterium]|nr:hypothetical protein [Gammaproteobacteria bacterium]